MSKKTKELKCIHRKTVDSHPNCFRKGLIKWPTERYVNTNSPVIGILDIETLPMEVYTFDLFNVNISIDKVISEVGFLGWAGKFLNGAEIYSDILTPEEAPNKDDRRITKSCWDFMSKCDIIIGHNLSSFDSKLTNTFFLKCGLPPIKYIAVDTLLIAKSNFRFSSNKLSFINSQLGIRDKFSTDFSLWKRCHQGDPKALSEMNSYNVNDILITEELYYKFRPYIRNINVALYNEMLENQCPVCGSTKLNSEGFYYTSAGKWESVRCTNCKALSRKKDNLLSIEKKKSLVINS